MKHLFKKGIYSKLFINITLSVVFAIIFTSIVLYSSFKSMIMKYEYQAKVEQLESKQAQVSKLSEVAVKIGNQIYHDVNVSKLLYYKNPNIYDMSAAFNQLRTYRLTIPYIESIYVYNKFNDYIYVEADSEYSELTKNGYVKQSDGFADSSANYVIEHFKNYKPYRPIARLYQEEDSKEIKYFYTFFMYDSYTKDKKTSGVLINFKTDYLLDGSENKGKSDSEYFIVGSDGIVVSNASSLDMMKNYSDTSYIGKIIANGDKQGYFTDFMNGEKIFLVYTQRDQYGWQYVSITQYDTLLRSVNWMQVLTILFSILFVCIGVLIAFLITKWIYHPINEMQTDIKELEHEKRKAKNILKRVYISDLLSGKEADNREYLAEYFNRLNMGIDFSKNLALVLFRIDQYKNVVERNDSEMIQAFKFALLNVYIEILEEEYSVNGTDMGESDVLLFVNMEAGADPEKFISKLQYARKVVNGYFNISFTIIVSSMDKKPEKLTFLYNQVTEAAMHRVFYDRGSIIPADKLKHKQANEFDYPVAKEKQLIEALLVGKIDEVKEIYQVIISNLQDYPISIFNMVIARLVVTLNNGVNILRKNSGNSVFEGKDMVLLLHNTDSSGELTKQFYDFFDLVGKELMKKKAGKHDALIEQIKNLIHMKYVDPNFSIEDIAEALNKSLPYISRIYAQYSGTTIKETISELRMDKARQLLEDKDLSIHEIAEQVGFSSSSYFHKAFKKLNGVTPKEFQEKTKQSLPE